MRQCLKFGMKNNLLDDITTLKEILGDSSEEMKNKDVRDIKSQLNKINDKILHIPICRWLKICLNSHFLELSIQKTMQRERLQKARRNKKWAVINWQDSKKDFRRQLGNAIIQLSPQEHLVCAWNGN